MAEHLNNPVMGVSLIGSLESGLRPAAVVVRTAAQVVEVIRGGGSEPLAFALGVEGHLEQVIIPTSVVRSLCLALGRELAEADTRLEALKASA